MTRDPAPLVRAVRGFGEDIPDEDIGRAMLAVNANISPTKPQPCIYQGHRRFAELRRHAGGSLARSIGESISCRLRHDDGCGFAYFKGLRMPGGSLAKRPKAITGRQ